ncbi:MAG: TAXI family TRAP transporter solute-binding subunit [Rhodospirillales bacterium]
MTRAIARPAAAAAAAALLAAAPAAAQQAPEIGIATSPQGTLFYSIATAVAKVVTGDGKVRALIQPYGGGSQWLPLLNRGEIGMGMASAIDSDDAGRGVGTYAGNPHPNVRVGGAMASLQFTMFVKDELPAKTVADLKGMRIPAEYPSALVVVRAMTAYIAAAGMTFADFTPVPTSTLAQNAADFKTGKVDIGTLPVGAGAVTELNASVKGGIRYLNMDDSPAALARMHKVLPYVYTQVLTPSPARVGIREPITVMAYDTWILLSKDLPDATVYEIVKSVHAGKDALSAAFPWFRAFDPAKMAKKFTVEYHPGAVKYFTEQGQWPPKG